MFDCNSVRIHPVTTYITDIQILSLWFLISSLTPEKKIIFNITPHYFRVQGIVTRIIGK